jgi:hypothetical protein
MGYNLIEFLDLTPRQFFNAVGGFVQREETKLKESWEQTRIILTAVVNKPVYGYKHRPQDAKKVLPLPWDNETVEVTQEDLDRLKQEMREHNKKSNG